MTGKVALFHFKRLRQFLRRYIGVQFVLRIIDRAVWFQARKIFLRVLINFLGRKESDVKVS